MNREELVENITFLINKYVPEKSDLIRIINDDIDSTKYVLAEIDKYKEKEYDKEDLDLLKDIAYYYL